MESDQASCFYHPNKKASVPCDNCGRFLCALCDVDFGGRRLCPACIEAGSGTESETTLDTRRILYDKLALFLRKDSDRALAAGPGFHLAFAAPSQEAVAAFHAGALANGGTDEGGPGLRPHYGATYYAAFVRDPDGHKLEAKHA